MHETQGQPYPDNAPETAPENPGRSRKIRIRIAVCVALVIAIVASGLVICFSDSLSVFSDSLYICGKDTLTVTMPGNFTKDPTVSAVILEEGVYDPAQAFLGWTNFYGGIPTQLSVDTADFPADKISYSICCTAGLFSTDNDGYTNDLSASKECKNNQTFHWELSFGSSSQAEGLWYDQAYDKVYSKIIIYCEGHIIGYAVMRYDRIYSDEWAELQPDLADSYAQYEEPIPLDVYHCTLVKSVSFPKIFGKYQAVTEESVQHYIQRTIDKDN